MHRIIHAGVCLQDLLFGIYQPADRLARMLYRIIKNGRYTAACCCACSGQVTVCGYGAAKRHLKMGVGIQCSREHQLAGCIIHLFCLGRINVLLDGRDTSILYSQICLIHICSCNDRSIFDH